MISSPLELGGSQGALASVHLVRGAVPNLALNGVDHCLATKDLTYLGTLLTSVEVTKLRSQAGQAEVKANVKAYIRDYDANKIVANRKAAIEYCFQANNIDTNKRLGRAPAGFDPCMNQHDMLQAMCKQELELRVAYSMRNYAARPRPPQTCAVPHLTPREVGAIADLPAKFTAPPPDVSIAASAPPTAIPTGTVLHTSLQLGINAISIERNQAVRARLDEPLAVGGQALFTAGTYIFLKTRIIGPGPRPGSVQIGITTDWAMAQPDHHKVQISSDELIFTIVRQPSAPPGANLWIPPETKLSFTIKN